LNEENIQFSVFEKRTKWKKSLVEQAKQELLREKLISGEGVITFAGREKVKDKKKEEFSVNINAFNAKLD
jgi:adenylate cyclase